MTTADGVLSKLERELSPDSVVSSEVSLEAFRRDMAAAADAGLPLAVVAPASVDEVVTTVRLAHEDRVPVVPRGAGTGLSGGAAALDGCIVLSMQRMNQVLEISELDALAVVQPAVLNADVSRAAAGHGLAYMPDPASFELCSIGGNIATNAGGLRCVRYGATRESVLGLQVVVPPGRVLRTGSRAVRDVAGYDLTGLFVGSEGTLGVITEATLRLRPAPRSQATVVATFDSVEKAGEAVCRIVRSMTPTILELMDAATVAAIESWRPAGLDKEAEATLIVQCDDDPSSLVAELEARLGESDAKAVVSSTDPSEAQLLVGIRRLAHPALERLGVTILDDVSVPIGSIARLLSNIQSIPPAAGVKVAVFGHAGNGNLHPAFIFERGDKDGAEAAMELAGQVSRLAVSVGGSVTGEHGVGSIKRDWYRSVADEASLEFMKAIKLAFDPHGIMNPGKAF